MAETMYLLLPRDHGEARWLLVDTLGNRIGFTQHGSLVDAASQAKGRRLTALAPGEHVSLVRVEIPSKNAQKALQAAPFLLEDRLAEDVESLHFAASAQADGAYLVSATARARMRHWLDLMSEAGMQPAQLVPDLCALAPESDTTRVVLDEDRALVRFPDGTGFAAETELVAQILKRRLMNAVNPLKQVVLHAAESTAANFAGKLSGIDAEIHTRPLADGVLPLLSMGARAQRAFSLLQGDFQLRSNLQEHWRAWRVATILLGLCLLLALVQQVFAFVHLKREAATLDAEVTQVFNQAMPGSVMHPGNEDGDMKSLLTRLQGGSSAGSLLPLLGALGNTITATPSVQIIGINYQGGSLQVQLQASDVGSLDALKAALARQNGLSVNLDSVSASGNQVTGRIVLAGNPA